MARFGSVALSLGAAICLVLAGAPKAADAPQYKIVHRYGGPDGGWDYASFDQAQGRLFVSHGDAIMTVDVGPGTVNGHFADAARSHAVVPIPGTGQLLTTNSGDDTVRIFDAKTGALQAKISTAKGPDAAAWDPASKHVFVMAARAGEADIVDPATKTAVGSVPIGGALEFAVADGKGKLFVNIEDKGEIAVVDTKAGKLLTKYSLAGCEEPSGLALTTGGVLISACANGVAKAVDAASGKEIATLKIGARPDAVIYDPGRGLAFIPCGGDGTLTVISAKGHSAEVIGSAETQRGARTGAVDPRSGHIFLPAAKFGPPPAPGQRPTMTPGSFEVLELAPG
jgi:DNA-binding beta-propeller fold protein YncE